MKRLLLVCIGSGYCSSAALASDPYEAYLTQQNQRGTQIELIRVASEKPLIEEEETDAEVAKILEEAEAIEEEASDNEDIAESS